MIEMMKEILSAVRAREVEVEAPKAVARDSNVAMVGEAAR